MALSKLDKSVYAFFEQAKFQDKKPLQDGWGSLDALERKVMSFLDRANSSYSYAHVVWAGCYDILLPIERSVQSARSAIDEIKRSAHVPNENSWNYIKDPLERDERRNREFRFAQITNRRAKYLLLDISQFASDPTVRQYAKENLEEILKSECMADYRLPLCEMASINQTMKQMGIF